MGKLAGDKKKAAEIAIREYEVVVAKPPFGGKSESTAAEYAAFVEVAFAGLAELLEASKEKYENTATGSLSTALPDVVGQWGMLTYQIDNLPMPMKRALADGAMPPNQAGLVFPDFELMPGSPETRIADVVQAIAKDSYELHKTTDERIHEEGVREKERQHDQAVRKEDRQHEWSMRRITILVGLLGVVLGSALTSWLT